MYKNTTKKPKTANRNTEACELGVIIQTAVLYFVLDTNYSIVKTGITLY
jgi:hypothetical protein